MPKTGSSSPGGKKPTRSGVKNRNTAASGSKAPDKGASSVAEGPFSVKIVLAIVAVLLLVFMFAGNRSGSLGGAVRRFLLGMNGAAAYVLPLLIIFGIVIWSLKQPLKTAVWKTVCLLLALIFSSVLLHIFFDGAPSTFPGDHYARAAELRGGGVVGGVLGQLLVNLIGKIGTFVVAFAVMFICIIFLLGFTPKTFIELMADKAADRKERRAAEKLREREERAKREKYEEDRYGIREVDFPGEIPDEVPDDVLDEVPDEVPEKRDRWFRRERRGARAPEVNEPLTFRFKRKKPFTPDIDIDDDEFPEDGRDETTETQDEIDERIFREVMEKTRRRQMLDGEDVAEYADDDVEIPEIIDVPKNTEQSGRYAGEMNDSELLERLNREYIGGDSRPEKKEKPEPKKKYMFPPIDLLHEDTDKKDTDVREELHDNAVKLVETLRSFNVRTRVENVSRGPAITRYELLPEPGTRVRSILNLVDDISLNLATTGVRIEAPVPGKSVVGIEVPNKNKAVVHLRTLIGNRTFRKNDSKLCCALGEDVAGETVYLDIGKMPHLLIAGATGMGKSVCINSLIVSLLYKASPEEVKLILVDPKKVELNIYNGIPHLLVPVVTDPKKAAGSLSWAVSEMERRFGLIEAVGVRDVTAFNEITKNDPEYEFLPYIVIIIDELADLMMTAPDDVEKSICRLMQKARAAGMHVIIGTQRPSVDVITGLIKANIPSRIAFTVASQVDSRTIIDRAGAENLIGRGDMLYLPVSASKPIRVQGAYVSEGDVEKVVTFIKEKNGTDATYSKEVIDKIEEAAENVGRKKGEGSSDGEPSGDDDPMLREALELAVSSGKISTSLIQRKLSLGYGRAAKLIDRMQELGYVSEPSGQKPREVLITREQLMEMKMRNEDGVLPEGGADDGE